jgi:hypothetical protein
VALKVKRGLWDRAVADTDAADVGAELPELGLDVLAASWSAWSAASAAAAPFTLPFALIVITASFLA